MQLKRKRIPEKYFLIAFDNAIARGEKDVSDVLEIIGTDLLCPVRGKAKMETFRKSFNFSYTNDAYIRLKKAAKKIIPLFRES